MAFIKYILILLFSCYCCLITCDINLSEGSACISEGLNGTCVSVYRCPTAALTYIYLNAGLSTNSVPKFPEICKYKDGIPVVCCTDCKILDNEWYKDKLINTYGTLIAKKESKAFNKCLEYLQYLPYKCRGHQQIKVEKTLNFLDKCHAYSMSAWSAVGGRLAERWEFPHMALLGFGDTQEQAEWHCGGSVISERFILTAAHCVYSDLLKSTVSFAALGLLKRSDPVEYWKTYKIKRAIRHPQYSPPSPYYDIALLETDTEINFGQYLLPACLDTEHTQADRSTADASGWGELGHKNPLADTLQVITIKEFNETECFLQYPVHRLLKRGYDHSSQMCYGSHNTIVDTCRGDSGGPLQINIDNMKCMYHVIGVTSFGTRNCGILGVPTVYTRVSHYVPWIESIVWPD